MKVYVMAFLLNGSVLQILCRYTYVCIHTYVCLYIYNVDLNNLHHTLDTGRRYSHSIPFQCMCVSDKMQDNILVSKAKCCHSFSCAWLFPHLNQSGLCLTVSNQDT
jgi:hypothetical protein